MKKFLVILLIAAVAMTALFANGSQEEKVKTYKVGVGIYNFDDNFMTLNYPRNLRHQFVLEL